MFIDNWGLPRSTGSIEADRSAALLAQRTARTDAQRAAVALRLADIRALLADRLRGRYKAIGDAQGHKFGEGGPGAKPADFNAPLPPAAPASKPVAPSPPPATPPAERQ